MENETIHDEFIRLYDEERAGFGPSQSKDELRFACRALVRIIERQQQQIYWLRDLVAPLEDR